MRKLFFSGFSAILLSLSGGTAFGVVVDVPGAVSPVSIVSTFDGKIKKPVPEALWNGFNQVINVNEIERANRTYKSGGRVYSLKYFNGNPVSLYFETAGPRGRFYNRTMLGIVPDGSVQEFHIWEPMREIKVIQRGKLHEGFDPISVSREAIWVAQKFFKKTRKGIFRLFL